MHMMRTSDTELTLYDVVQPDLFYVSEARKRILTESHVQGAPDLVVEVLSPSTRRRDESSKLKLYERSDVDEYWLVDPASRSVRVHRRAKGRLLLAADLGCDADDHLRSPLLPALSLPLVQWFGA